MLVILRCVDLPKACDIENRFMDEEKGSYEIGLEWRREMGGDKVKETDRESARGLNYTKRAVKGKKKYLPRKYSGKKLWRLERLHTGLLQLRMTCSTFPTLFGGAVRKQKCRQLGK